MRVLACLFLMGFSFSQNLWADEIVQAPAGGWGDPNAASDMLKMNKDPAIVRESNDSEESVNVTKTCTNAAGQTLTRKDQGYRACLDQAEREARSAASSQSGGNNPPPTRGHGTGSQL